MKLSPAFEVATFLLLLFGAIGSGCAPEYWSAYRAGPSHDGLLDGGMHQPPIKVLWRTRLGRPDAVMSSPITDGVAIYEAANDTLFALSPEDGSILWRLGFPKQRFATPCLWHGVIYGATNGSQPFAYAVRSGGTVLWTKPLPSGSASAVAVLDGFLFIGLRDHGLKVLRTLDGEPQWQAVYSGGNVPGGTAPAASTGCVYWTDRGGVQSYEAGPLAVIRWHHYLDQAGAAPAVAPRAARVERQFVVVRNGDRVVILRAEDGAVVWQDRAICPDDPGFAIANNTLYYFDGKLIAARRLRDGHTFWYRSTYPHAPRRSPIVIGNLVYYFAGNTLYFVRRLNGEPLGSVALSLATQPRIFEGAATASALLVPIDGELVALSPAH